MPKKSSIAIFLAASSALAITTSNTKSASKGISVFHSFNPPKSFSPAYRAFVSDEVMASALVAAKKIAIELFFDIGYLFFFILIKFIFIFYLVYKMILINLLMYEASLNRI